MASADTGSMNAARGFPKLLLLGLLASGTSQAAEPTNTFVLYGLGVGITGEATAGPLTANIDMSFSEILDHLKFAAMGTYRWDSDDLSFQMDTIYASLGGEQTGSQGLARATVDLDQLMFEIDGGYKLNKHLEFVLGARYWNFDTRIALYGNGPVGVVQSSDSSRNWVDPLVGFRAVVPISENWIFVARGDVGGFGLGSDFAWDATAFFDWRFGKNFSMAFGYRYFDLQFDDRGGADAFDLDMQQGGPAIGVAYTF